MNRFEHFIKERKILSARMTSDAYLWNGYAYKCFVDDYPDKWIKYEYCVQKQIAKSNLNIAKYYHS